ASTLAFPARSRSKRRRSRRCSSTSRARSRGAASPGSSSSAPTAGKKPRPRAPGPAPQAPPRPPRGASPPGPPRPHAQLTPPPAAGPHGGEAETSRLLELAPASVRRDRLAAGRLDVPEPPSALFYPSLRDNAPDGTVGDPRRAKATSGRVYLDVWADALVAA